MLIEFESIFGGPCWIRAKYIATIHKRSGDDDDGTLITVIGGNVNQVTEKLAEVHEKVEKALAGRESKIMIGEDGQVTGWWDRDGEFHQARSWHCPRCTKEGPELCARCADCGAILVQGSDKPTVVDLSAQEEGG